MTAADHTVAALYALGCIAISIAISVARFMRKASR